MEERMQEGGERRRGGGLGCKRRGKGQEREADGERLKLPSSHAKQI